MRSYTIKIVRTAIIAGLYFVLTFFIPAISYGPMQFRISEALTLLPVICPEATLGLTIGCILANITSPYGWVDIVFGSLATLLAGISSVFIGKWLKRKKLAIRAVVGGLPPTIINAFAIPLIWFLLGVEEVYWINVAMLFVEEAIVVYVIGIPLILALGQTKILKNN